MIEVNMENNKLLKPAYIFEVSWEVCNKVGGIHTVVSTKALNMLKEYSNSHILIGPDVWRQTENNPEFIDDQRLFRSWRHKAAQEGLRVKIGRWNVAGNPIVILVDFSTFISSKDDIFTTFWKKYGLDSISGQWDYIEPALFGYAAGKVIESFVSFNSSLRQRIIAQFHEWMTGTGLLYLKSVMPQVGCVFTTHATVLGRCVAGNSLPLYSEMENYDPEELVRRFNVTSKQSLEKAAAQNADCFTTVSDITARECAHFLGKKVDIVTPNGFENVFTPSEEDWKDRQNIARTKFLDVAKALLGRPVADDALVVGISGRYEFKNKGMDVFIDAMHELNSKNEVEKEILAFVLVPAGHSVPNSDMMHNLSHSDTVSNKNPYLTHYLVDEDNDPTINRIKSLNMRNAEGGKVNIFFVPCYLNGSDGVFNMPYYDLLIGLDLTVFPSYYEPWGYTPMESLAFKVPSLTTTLAGFGLWVRDHYDLDQTGINVITREDIESDNVSKAIASWINNFATLDQSEVDGVRANAKDISKIALWDNLVTYYKQAYEIALHKVNERVEDLPMIDLGKNKIFTEKKIEINQPTWMTVVIQSSIPEKLIALEELTKNLWWSWNKDARELFDMIDSNEWNECNQNPIALLDSISLERYNELENDVDFVAKLNEVDQHFQEYMAAKDSMSGDGVAYFSMEYGIDRSLKIYSGGLGILAGDYLKEASDKKTKITAVGLLYRYGYFTQKLSTHGEQEAEYESVDFMKTAAEPVFDNNGNWLMVNLVFPGRNLSARVWRVDVGRIELYLLDTDFEDNLPEDRSITHHLYGGDWENRLKQELLLGCGGIQALRKLGIEASTYHCNEGHAAFTGLERLKDYIVDEGLAYQEAVEVVRSSSLFTTHTPVPAGHDAFTEDLLRIYLSHYPEKINISWQDLMSLGKINVADQNEKFSMSFLAANLAQEINGVSWLHGEVSKGIFKGMWPGYLSDESHISYVTNGVHYPTWTAPEWIKIQEPLFGEGFKNHDYNKNCFENIFSVPDSEVVAVRSKLRKRLINHIKNNILSDFVSAPYFTPRQVLNIQETLKDDILTIGFARRFATYKRAHLLFSNLDRLNAIVNNPLRPVQFIFAGKAHPADKAGQDLIKRIVEISKYPQFLGKILFLPNYDMRLAKKLVQGVDVWMNTPTRPEEASGTSGEKAAMNGVMHFSVLDGWWVEGYREDAGWMLPMKRTFDNQAMQDELDSEMIYNIIEDQIAPMYYDKDENGISPTWVKTIKNTIAYVASNFTTHRMLGDYERQFYVPMSVRYQKMIANNFQMAIDLSEWKKKINREWNNIEFVDMNFPNRTDQMISLGKSYSGELRLELGELDMSEIGVELIVAEQKNEQMIIRKKFAWEPVLQDGSIATYRLDAVAASPGMLKLAIRVYPKNDLLPHRQDFSLVKWL